MADYNDRYNFSACGFVGIPVSIVIGIIVGILFAFEFIPGIETAAWIAFGLGVLGLIILVAAVFVAVSTESRALTRCLQLNVNCLLTGIWGTILSGLAALSIELTPGSILIAVLVGIGAFFFSLMIVSLILFILYVVFKLHLGNKPVTPNNDC